MSRTFRNLILLLAAVLGLGVRAYSADASITVSGNEKSGDSGSITISFSDGTGHSYSETVTYGQFSTQASIASAFGAKFSNDYFPSGLLCAHAVGSVIYFHLKGSNTFGLPSLSYPSTSFSLATSAWQVQPVVSWPAPVAISFGTALSGTQLNATANVAGTFVYSPATGAIMLAGTDTLSVTFTPTNPLYATVTVTVPLVVNPGSTTITCW